MKLQIVKFFCLSFCIICFSFPTAGIDSVSSRQMGGGGSRGILQTVMGINLFHLWDGRSINCRLRLPVTARIACGKLWQSSIGSCPWETITFGLSIYQLSDHIRPLPSRPQTHLSIYFQNYHWSPKATYWTRNEALLRVCLKPVRHPLQVSPHSHSHSHPHLHPHH